MTEIPVDSTILRKSRGNIPFGELHIPSNSPAALFYMPNWYMVYAYKKQAEEPGSPVSYVLLGVKSEPGMSKRYLLVPEPSGTAKKNKKTIIVRKRTSYM